MTYDTHYKHACDVVIHRMHIRIVGVDLAAAARLQLAICIDRCGQCCVSLQAHPAPEISPLLCSSEVLSSVLTSEFCCSAALLASVGCEEFQPFRVCGRLLLYILLQYADLAAAAFFLNAFLAGFFVCILVVPCAGRERVCDVGSDWVFCACLLPMLC